MTFTAMSAWPASWKAAISMAILILMGGLGYLLDTGPQMAKLNTLQRAEQDLQQKFVMHYRLWQQTVLYNQQITRLHNTLAEWQKQLLKPAQLPSLLAAISQAAQATNLNLQTVNFLPQQTQGNYLVLPIQLTMVGDYYQLGMFMTKLAALPYLLTDHAFMLSRWQPGKLSLEEQWSVPENALAMQLGLQVYQSVASVTARGQR